MDDRELLSREMKRLTAEGWEITSLSVIGFQAKKVHTVSDGLMALLVVAPTILGVLVALFSTVWASALFSFALVCAALMALHHLSVAPRLLYISADQLRNPAPASVVRDTSNGISVCSVCQQPVRSDAKMCSKCNATFAPPPAVEQRGLV